MARGKSCKLMAGLMILALNASVSAKTQYIRVVGAGDSGAENPPGFSTLIAYEPSDGTALVLDDTLFQPDRTVVADSGLSDLSFFSMTDDLGNMLQVNGGLGTLETFDPVTTEGITQFYAVSVTPATFAITTPLTVRPVATLTTPKKYRDILRKSLLKIKRRYRK